jgi:phosphatidylglycerophosphatase A
MAEIPTPIRLIATVFGAGTFPAASGTFGSVVAIPFAYAMLQIPVPYNRLVLLLAVTAVLLLGVWASNRYCAIEGSTDPGAIVIDEVAGQWLALIFAAPGNPWHFFAGFLLFRFFDITKLWPANWAQDHLPGGWGVMMDDIVAGLWAAGILYAGIYVGELPNVASYLQFLG